MQKTEQLKRFAVTGIGSTAIHVVIAFLLIEILTVNSVLANACAFIVATTFSYLVNTHWSFGTKTTLRNATRFWTTACVGLALAIGLSAIAQYQNWHYLSGIVLVVSVVPIVSFLLHSAWSYR